MSRKSKLASEFYPTNKSVGVVTAYVPRSSGFARGQQFRRINDRIFGGPRGTVQRYSSSIAARDVISKSIERQK